LAAYAGQLNTDITAAEVNRKSPTSGGWSAATMTFVYSTAGQMRTALREAYRNATRVEAVMIGDFLSSLTDGQLQTLFGLTAGQVTTLRTSKLTPAATAAASIRATTGA